MKKPNLDQMHYELAMAGGGLYSAVDQAAQNIKRKEGPGQAFINELMKQPNVKKDELEERGLTAMAQKPKMTRDEMLRELKIHEAPQIQERVLKTYKPDEDEVHELAREIWERDHQEDKPLNMSWHDALETARESLYEENEHNQAEHESYTLPGGSNYRELLLHLPQDRWHPQNNYKSPHYGVQNILAHMRLKDREGPAGEKLLHLEELQSDWHQAGRDKGYGEIKKPVVEAYYEDSNGNIIPVGFGRTKEEADSATDPNWKKLVEIKYRNYDQVIGHGVPNGPFKNNWHEMALKHLINHAAKNGYQGIVVTPAKDQIDRYEEELRKNLDALHYEPFNDERTGKKMYEISGVKGGKEVLNQEVAEDELKGLVGKDIFQKMQAHEGENVGTSYRPDWRKIEGKDLTIGGEGMKQFYDRTVPDTLNKLGKKYGAKTQLNAHPLPNTEQGTTMGHHFPITEEMRQGVLQHGHPMYDHGGVVHKAEGGTMNPTPTMAEMRLALLRSNPLAVQSYGANEAPGMNPKAYIPPDIQQDKFPPPGGAALPTGGIDTNPTQAGQQLMPQQQQGVPPSPPGAAGQPAPQSLQGQGSPLQQPPSNILQMTPQGQALNAIKPPQAPQAPQGMKDGSAVKKEKYTPPGLGRSENEPKIARAPAKTNQELEQIALRIAPQMLGQFENAKHLGDVTGGKTLQQYKREQELQHDLRKIKETGPVPEVDLGQHVGKVMVGLPGDYTRSNYMLHGVGNTQFENPVHLEGGSRYSETHPDALWASQHDAAQNVQNLANAASRQHNDADVLATHLKMSPDGMYYALHFAKPILEGIAAARLSRSDQKHLTDLIRNKEVGFGTFPGAPHVKNLEALAEAVKIFPEFRKHLGSLMMKKYATEPFGLPSGADIMHAVSEPSLRNLETGVTGHTIGELHHDKPLTESGHGTYSADIPGKFLGKSAVPIPYELQFPDAVKALRESKNPKHREALFGTLKMFGARQQIHPQLVDEIGRYRDMVKKFTGKKKGGKISKDTMTFELTMKKKGK